VKEDRCTKLSSTCTVLRVGVLLFCTAGASAAPNTWSQISLSGQVPGPSYNHGLAADGTMLYLFGGDRGCLGYMCFGGSNEMTQIDTASGVCTRLDAGANVTGIPPNPRNGHGFAAWEGVLYVFGGTAKDMSSSVHSYVYTLGAMSCTDITSGTRHGSSSTVLQT
jgi:hypothetical protein